jgi:hypothetical protein
MNSILKDLNLLTNKKENNTLTNLTKIPPKEPRNVAPHTYAPVKNATQQADLLHLPDDDGYRYLLVVVDIATRLTDAQPLKSKDSEEVKKALIKIYKRKYISKPLRLEVDSGSEFKGVFKTYFDKLFKIITKMVGRHRQQSVVETKNYQIGKILNLRMLAEEINNDEDSHSWVDIIPEVIKLINQYMSHPAIQIDPNDPIKTNKFTSQLLPVGTKVRIQLDNPKSYTDNRTLHGKFRAGDIRWTREVHTITQFYLRPDQPPMYQVDDNTNVAYTKYQLQVVDENEKKPNISAQKKYLIDKLIKRFKKNNKIYFEVQWNDGSITNEPRTNLIKDVPKLVEKFELAQTRK